MEKVHIGKNMRKEKSNWLSPAVMSSSANQIIGFFISYKDDGPFHF